MRKVSVGATSSTSRKQRLVFLFLSWSVLPENVVGSSSFVLDGSDYTEDSICIPPPSTLARPKEEEEDEAQAAILAHLLHRQNNDTLDEDYQERTNSTSTIDPLLPSRKEDDSCGVYFATSTIAGGKAGNGIFAGKAFAEGDLVTPGDLAVLLTDLEFHHPWQTRTNKFLWEEYVWESHKDEATMADMAIFGIGAAVNCDHGLVNVDRSSPETTWSERITGGQEHPGAGASTVYHNVYGFATQDIQPGMELFLDYGEDYFSSRDHYNAPSAPHFEKGTKLLQSFATLRDSVVGRTTISNNNNNKTSTTTNSTTAEQTPAWVQDLYRFVKEEVPSLWEDGTATIATLPDEVERVDDILESKDIGRAHVHKSIRSVEWLHQHGSCADHLQAQPSTLPHAGRGAFTRRPIAQGETVAPVPLIHIAHRSIFDMYETLNVTHHQYGYPMSKSDEKKRRRKLFLGQGKEPAHQQLLLNYCFGHAETDILLCPYGIGTALINHSPEHDKANVKMVWSTKHTTHPEWFDQHPRKWANHIGAGLAWEFVATRDLAAGEEVLIDYGHEWDEAWSNHVASWSSQSSLSSSCRPLSAHYLNEERDQWILPTWSEGYDSFSLLNSKQHTQDPAVCDSPPPQAFPKIRCHDVYLDMAGLSEYSFARWRATYPCRPVDRYLDEDTGTVLYTVELYSLNQNLLDKEDEDEEEQEEEDDEEDDEEDPPQCEEFFEGIMFNVPGDVFHFVDRPYTSDASQPWSFRHDMRIPDHLLPSAWTRRNDAQTN